MVEITASAKKNIVKRLKRKRQLYIDETGIVPSSFIFAVGSIHSKRVATLHEAGFEVLEPDDDDE
ncbi:MAG: hypothetical protein B6242_00315 [Anaerolineaceae bacterium 4572_78]|nr:MAG: hypothetical protein B6242_00315 [Anaerolineaceae bacterium 4572_78]